MNEDQAKVVGKKLVLFPHEDALTHFVHSVLNCKFTITASFCGQRFLSLFSCNNNNTINNSYQYRPIIEPTTYPEVIGLVFHRFKFRITASHII